MATGETKVQEKEPTAADDAYACEQLRGIGIIDDMRVSLLQELPKIVAFLGLPQGRGTLKTATPSMLAMM